MELGHPILSCEAARELETELFAGEEEREWRAMQQAGRAVAAAVLRDFREIGGFPSNGRILVLAGKGHNAGDALIAAQTILHAFPEATAEVVFVLGQRTLRPLAMRAWRELAQAAGARVRVRRRLFESDAANQYALSLDGIFGFQFRPPLPELAAQVLREANALPVSVRAAVDLPSGLAEPDVFRADFTYATGIVKRPLLDIPSAGRIRYLDLGFFTGRSRAAPERVLTAALLAPLAALRPARADKRTFGHLFVLGGSRGYPGAVLMTVLGALRSGAGLVTAFVPESLVPAFAARAPEAMWVGWPETPDGGLALEGQHLLQARLPRASALVLGPGIGREAETLALMAEVVKRSTVPVTIDADALQPDIVRSGNAVRVLTPHAGEYARIAGGEDVSAFAAATRATVVLKGPATLIAAPGAPVHFSFFGGPVLARGGSGDVLAGLIGGLLAQTPGEPLLAATRGVVWHGVAADRLARTHGQVAVQTTQLLECLPLALRFEDRRS